MESCSTCKKIKEISSKTILSLIPDLIQLYDEGYLALYAGSGYVDRIMEDIKSEKYFTYDYYFRCKECDEIYYLGICIRGTPIFRKVKEPSEIKFDPKRLGYGEYFNPNWKD